MLPTVGCVPMRNGRFTPTARKADRGSGCWFLPALGLLALVAMNARLVSSDEPKRLDPAAWGSDHVGQPVPEYATGDECLFCHRKTGATWDANRHNRTVRPFDPEAPAGKALKRSPAKGFADAVQFVLGGRQRQRYLRPSKEYGKLELLSAQWVPPRDGKPGRLVSTAGPHWDETRFGDSCAGCHTTAVDP